MSFARELAEAVEAPSIEEQVAFLEALEPDVATAVHTGIFTPETLEGAMEAVLRASGATEDDEPVVFEVIDEFVDDLGELEEGFFSDVAKSALKTAAGMAATALSQKKKEPTKLGQTDKHAKLKHTLRHAAAGALKQIAKDPSKTKEVLKKSAGKLVKKGVRGAVRKGMKMVFGRWVDTGKPNKAKSTGKNVREDIEQPELTEAIAPASLVPIFSRASGTMIDPVIGKKLAVEFVEAMRAHIAEKWRQEMLSEVEPTNSKTVKGSDEGPEGGEIDFSYEMPTQIETLDTFPLGIIEIVERMPSAKRVFGHGGFVDFRRNLARALMADLKLAKRIIEQAAQSSMRSWSVIMTDDLQRNAGVADSIREMIEDSLTWGSVAGIPSEYMPSSRIPLVALKGLGNVSLTLKRLVAEPKRGSKFVKNPLGEDVPMEVTSVWDVRGEPEVEVDWDTIYDAGRRAAQDARRYGSRWHDVFG